MEEWRPVIGYEGLYEVSNTGKVRSLDQIIKVGKNGQHRFQQGRQLSLLSTQRGELVIVLTKNGIKERVTIHRLVAMSFVPNPLNKKIVKHKNKIKTDNNADNLEWVTDKESKRGVYKEPHIGARKPVLQIKDGVVVNEYESIVSAGRAIVEEYKRMGFPVTMTPEKNIVNAVKNGKHAYGYTWKYKN